jgi:DNA-binding MarR family transcriptional regulator
MQTSTGTIPLFTEVGGLIKSRLQHGLSLPFSQCQTLWFVAEHKRPNMQDVAKHFKITAPSATFLVEELVHGGHLIRHASSADRRKVELVLTPKGKQVVRVLIQKRKVVLNKIFESLSSADRNDLNRILKKILTNA